MALGPFLHTWRVCVYKHIQTHKEEIQKCNNGARANIACLKRVCVFIEVRKALGPFFYVYTHKSM